MSKPQYETDVVVVGAGPAGVAAAVMAASLNLRTIVVEPGRVGGKLHTIGALENVSGSWSNGPQLAEALTADLERLTEAGRCAVIRAYAVSVCGLDDHAELTLEGGGLVSAQAVVVATGVAALTPPDVDWVSTPAQFSAPSLWRAAPQDLAGKTYVIGGDRPLGTWLRAHPEASTTLHVLCPPTDDYKVEEVARDDRIRIVPVAHVAIARPTYGDGWLVEVEQRSGDRTTYMATTLLSNLGNKPAALEGLARGEDGYCPPEHQHPRIHIAGDLRSARYQRIATSQGSGAEAVLAHYYTTALQKA
ncbi:FAD-dependent oxidoreductase [Streptomyces sp. ISL-10]|uniref:FAD-dependent oxidoreductase n=1 Tax=Streptomyces sp. ISL-10 TaxID=2819172 RepID=UPI001BE84D43|nr:FAD-dependent oxidoreductase [Streptomyces sp. ISL-10]MBT2369976.1 FAD-dependent oxidoreductase [Streptomyces sp. ISL-10]